MTYTLTSGSKRNWGSLSRSLAYTLHRPVYALDMRNHGHSPAVVPHNYQAMASDISYFVHSHDLWNVQLMGHSMGGKAAMAYALSEGTKQGDIRLEKLVVIDTAPSAGTAVGKEFVKYVLAMKRVNDIGVSSRKEAQAALSEVESVHGEDIPISYLLMSPISGSRCAGVSNDQPGSGL
jgi:pimeloyl-ACP methyl ester carboxylesterase